MDIIIEDTPNPETKKFNISHQILAENKNIQIDNIEQASYLPLFKNLFNTGNVKSIFAADNFISVTKTENIDWQDIKAEFLDIIFDHFIIYNEIILPEEKKQQKNIEYSTKDAAIVSQIIELLDSRIRPAVAQDGGDISFSSFKDGILYLKMQGACSGCPSSALTLKQGIENMLKYYVPEVESVEAIDE